MVSRWASVILLLDGLLNRYWRVSVATVSSMALAPRLAVSATSVAQAYRSVGFSNFFT